MSHSNQCGTPMEYSGAAMVESSATIPIVGIYLALLHIRQLNWKANIVFDQKSNKYKCKMWRLTFGLISKLNKQFCARDCERINRFCCVRYVIFAETAVCAHLKIIYIWHRMILLCVSKQLRKKGSEQVSSKRFQYQKNSLASSHMRFNLCWLLYLIWGKINGFCVRNNCLR